MLSFGEDLEQLKLSSFILRNEKQMIETKGQQQKQTIFQTHLTVSPELGKYFHSN